MRHQRIYSLLKWNGHHPAKAAEILLDASRGDQWARGWIRVLFSQRKHIRQEESALNLRGAYGKNIFGQ